MTSLKTIVAATAAAFIAIGAGAAIAKDAKTAAAKTRTPESIQCSKDADTKGLHGKDRKSFMSTCKKDAEAKKTDVSKPADTKPASADKKS